MTRLKPISILLSVLIFGTNAFPSEERMDDAMPDNSTGLSLTQALTELSNEKSPTENEICYSQECNHTVSSLLDSMDQSVDPCDDFYKYACGNWIKNNPVPKYTTSTNQYSLLREKISGITQEILEVEKNDNDSIPLQYAKEYYSSCLKMDTDKDTLYSILDGYGHWPIMSSEKWDSKKFNWINMLGDLHRNSSSVILFQLGIWQNTNDTLNSITMDKAEFVLHSKYLAEPDNYTERMDAYRSYVRDLLTEFSKLRQVQVKDLEANIEKIINFEIQLATYIEKRNKTSRVTRTLEEWDEWTSNLTATENLTKEFSFTQLLSRVFDSTGINLTEEERVNVFDEKYFEKMLILIDETPDEDIANFLHYRTLSNLLYKTPEVLRNVFFKFRQRIYGTQEPQPLTKLCADSTNSNYGMAVGQKYIQDYFNNKTEKSVIDIYFKVLFAFKSLVFSSSWMESDMKSALYQRAGWITGCVAYPEWIVNNTAVESHYEGLEVENGEYLHNYLQISRWRKSQDLQKLREPLNYNCSYSMPHTVNAFHHGQKYHVEFTAGLLQFPFYDNNRPASLNYGAIGTIIGHEISHDFDTSNFDKGWGIYENGTYTTRGQCLIDQYNNVNTTDIGVPIKVDGKLTITENFADLGGLWESYWALKLHLYVTGSEQKLVGLENFSSEKLFFISYANSQCENIASEALRHQMLTDAHAPEKVRAVVTLQNFPEFSNVFKCPVGSGMNPSPSTQKRCLLF